MSSSVSRHGRQIIHVYRWKADTLNATTHWVTMYWCYQSIGWPWLQEWSPVTIFSAQENASTKHVWFVHDCKANPNLSDDVWRKISYPMHCFLHKNCINRWAFCMYEVGHFCIIVWRKMNFKSGETFYTRTIYTEHYYFYGSFSRMSDMWLLIWENFVSGKYRIQFLWIFWV